MSENINENMTEKEAKKAEELKKKELEREKYQEQLNNPNLTKKEKKKLGFPTPIRVWLKSYLGKYVREIISNANVDKLINKEYVINLLDEHIEGKRDNSRKVWTVFMFCLWYELYIEGKSISELEFKSDFNKNGDMCRLA